MGLFSRKQENEKPAPEDLATEYMEANNERREEIKAEMYKHHGIVRYSNRTWGPELPEKPERRGWFR